jgi:hypothetical protein
VALEWLGLGLAVAKMLLRAADKSDAADALDDASGLWSHLRVARRQETAVGKAIATQLEHQLEGAAGLIEDDLRAAARDVADFFTQLAEDNNAVIAASTHPDQFWTTPESMAVIRSGDGFRSEPRPRSTES